MTEVLGDKSAKKNFVKSRLRERTGSIFKNRQESNMAPRGISHDQILISPGPPSLVQIAKNLEGDILSVSKHSTVDNIVILGSTGLTGGLIVTQLTRPWVYLNSTNDLQRKLNNLYPNSDLFEKHHLFLKKSRSPLCNGLTRKKVIQVVKNLFCFVRKPLAMEDAESADDLDSSWEHKLVYKGSNLVCTKQNIFYDKPTLTEGTLKIPDTLQKIPGSVELQIQQYTYRLVYDNSTDVHGESCRHTLTIDLKINVICLLEKESLKWPSLLKTLFGPQPTAVSVASKRLEKTTAWNFPPLDQVETLISALGSTSFQQRKTNVSRRAVDYDMNIKMIEAFCGKKTPGVEKKAVVITSFNNVVLSSTCDYFRTKLTLEQDLATRMPGLDKLILLRPGPLVGYHTQYSTGSPSQRYVKPAFVPTSLFNIYCFKRKCWQHQVRFVKDLMKYGLKVKVSEACARMSYGHSCSPLLGYAVPAYKVAFVAAIRAIHLEDGACFVELIRSDQIDKMA
ncbi:LADA_0B02366g1_1 [Lachancea dasiensis]|uniref:LADA_0B02366g1_1 n=1 Tax=Lachancea dasiensis TaxID=1072105 RepID=A0A1G4IS27_9SACH|nr:LADA_0B02366g1_1 [Lachancea dasiensis]